MARKPADPHPSEVIDRLRERGPQTRIAVVGASNDEAKYGNIIVKNLAAKGYTVLPVNPKGEPIAGLATYRRLAEVPPPIHVVSVVTPPAVTLGILKEAAALGLPAVFLQDGSHDEVVLDLAARSPFHTVYGACIMVVTARN